MTLNAHQLSVIFKKPLLNKAQIRAQIEVDLKKFDMTKIKIGKTSKKKIR
jgi:hypothetical protein